MKPLCPKCGSNAIMPDVPVVSTLSPFVETPVLALGYQRPEALLFKGPSPHRVRARVCGGCGFAELYVEDAKGLWETVQGAREA